MHKKVRETAAELLYKRLIAKLSEGDLVATQSKYHKACLTESYNKVRTFASKASIAEQEKATVEVIVVTEIERYMRGIIGVESDNIPVFYLKELKNVYAQQMKYHSYAVEYEDRTRFREKILKCIPELTEHKMGRHVSLAFKAVCGKAIFEACDLKDDGMCLGRAARMIRKEILSKQDEKKLSNKNDVLSKETLSLQSEIDSISPPVMSFVNMVLNGSNVDTSDNKEILQL